MGYRGRQRICKKISPPISALKNPCLVSVQQNENEIVRKEKNTKRTILYFFFGYNKCFPPTYLLINKVFTRLEGSECVQRAFVGDDLFQFPIGTDISCERRPTNYTAGLLW